MTRYELRTTLLVEGLPKEMYSKLEADFSSAFEQVGDEYPGMVAFFANADPSNDEIELGIRFYGVQERFAEDVADEILEKVLARLDRIEEDMPTSLERESSLLVPA